MTGKVKMYKIPTSGCNLEIMGYPFFAEEVSPTEAFRRREYNYNALVGGTQKVTKGTYVGLEFTVTTHVRVNKDKPYVYNKIFQEMMSKPVRVISPELGGAFYANVIIKPERGKLDYLKLTITIKEVPMNKSKIPGEEFIVPATRQIEVKNDDEDEEDSSEEDEVEAQIKSKRNYIPKKSK